MFLLFQKVKKTINMLWKIYLGRLKKLVCSTHFGIAIIGSFLLTPFAKDFTMTASQSTFTLKSPAFSDQQEIPETYTCEGQNISPPLQWQNTPEATVSYVLIMDDPDAPSGTWDHWIVFNIPASTMEFEEKLLHLPPPAKEGKNSWGKKTYGGPCPPKGKHRYYFKLYALDCFLDIADGATKSEVEKSMKSHILAKAELMGVYEKKY